MNKKGLMELFTISRFECIFFLLWFLPRIICKITILTWPSRRWRSPWRRKRIRSIDVSIIQNNRRMLVIICWDIGRNIFVPRLFPFDTFANHKCEQNNDENKSNCNRKICGAFDGCNYIDWLHDLQKSLFYFGNILDRTEK